MTTRTSYSSTIDIGICAPSTLSAIFGGLTAAHTWELGMHAVCLSLHEHWGDWGVVDRKAKASNLDN